MTNTWRYSGGIKIDKEEQEIREKMGKGIIATVEFQERMNKKVIEIKRPRRGRPRK